MKTTLSSRLRGAAFMIAASLAASLAAKDTNTSSPSQPSVPTPVQPDPATQVKHHDKEFLEHAAKGNMQEVMIAQAVVDRVANPQVRDFANTMIADHTASDKTVRALALSKGVVLEDWDAKSNAKLDEKWTEKGGNLDKKYVHAMVEDHEEDVKMFTKEAEKANDPEIAAFARDTLPTLQHHLEMARALEKSL